MSPRRQPGLTISIALYMHSWVTWDRRSAQTGTLPTWNIRLVSPWKPSLMTVTSMFRVSPSLSGLSFGMPWQTTWLIDVQIDFG
ncbi:hypothetical protein D3C73_1253210 [compost metagenome]